MTQMALSSQLTLNMAEAEVSPNSTEVTLASTKVTLDIGWQELLGKTAADMPEQTRQQRWRSWLALCRAKSDPGLAQMWSDANECGECIHFRDAGFAWCAEMELPCTVNPILTYRTGLIGMACMGMGRVLKVKVR